MSPAAAGFLVVIIGRLTGHPNFDTNGASMFGLASVFIGMEANVTRQMVLGSSCRRYDTETYLVQVGLQGKPIHSLGFILGIHRYLCCTAWPVCILIPTGL